MTPSFATRTGAGLLLGVIVSGLELNSLPLAGLPLADQVAAVVPMVLVWCGSAVIVAHLAYALEPRLSTGRFAMAMAVSFVVLSLASEWLLRTLAGFGFGMQAFLRVEPDRLGLVLHTLWQHFLYGVLAVTALALSRRGARMQAVLSHAVVAARQSEARMQAAAAQDLRGQIQPERLTRLIDELRVRYDQDLDSGDRLLERLTDFLRAAMPSVRSGTATLGQELDTLEAYGRLMAEVSPDAAVWTFNRPRSVPNLPFPALVLLPAAEAMAEAGGGRLDVRVRVEGPAVELQIASGGGRLPSEFSERLRASLRSVFADRATMAAEGPRLWIMMRQMA